MFGLDPFIIAFVGILGLALLLAGQTNLFRSKADQQLKEVERAGFSPKPFMNKSELKLFRILEGWLAQNARDHHISAQATYGAFLGCADYSKWRLMSAKRADFVIFDRTGNVQLIVEFDGGGHYGSTRQDAASVKSRDDQKNAAAATAAFPCSASPVWKTEQPSQLRLGKLSAPQTITIPPYPTSVQRRRQLNDIQIAFNRLRRRPRAGWLRIFNRRSNAGRIAHNLP